MRDLLYMHAPRGSLERVVAQITRYCAPAVVTIFSLATEDAKDAPWVWDLRCITLIDGQLPFTKDIFLDAQGNTLPPPDAYVDGSVAHPIATWGCPSLWLKCGW